jgi:hypothetical protein
MTDSGSVKGSRPMASTTTKTTVKAPIVAAAAIQYRLKDAPVSLLSPTDTMLRAAESGGTGPAEATCRP